MKIGDIVVDKRTLATIVGKTTKGEWIVEWADPNMEELGVLEEEGLFLVEETNGIPSEN